MILLHFEIDSVKNCCQSPNPQLLVRNGQMTVIEKSTYNTLIFVVKYDINCTESI